MHEFEIEKIQDTVWVFKNAVKNSKELIKYFETSREWKDWYTFGKVAEGNSFIPNYFKKFPSAEEWTSLRESRGKLIEADDHFEDEINNLFYEATKLYVQENDVSLDNWSFDGWNIAKYVAKDSQEFAMAYHTDYQREYTHNPGSKFVITAVVYLNDNYTGGELSFKFLDKDDNSIIKEEYTYKPSQGDIVMFPSGPPHYHGVKNVTEGEKYIIRTYWRTQYSGHPLWLRLQSKYGEEAWEKMEAERVRFTRNHENLTTVNQIPFYLAFEEYYQKEISELDS